MSCNNCNTTKQCSCKPVNCGCPFELETKCVRFTGNCDTGNLGIKKGEHLESIICKIDNVIEEVREEVENPITNINVGDGSPSSIGVFNRYDVIEDKYEFKSLNSNSLKISENEGTIYIDTISEDFVKTFYVNSKYTGDEELGTLAKPYKTFGGAKAAYIGTGTYYAPEFLGAKIVIFGESTNTTIENLNVLGLNLEVQEGSSLIYTGTDEYFYDMTVLQNELGGLGSQTQNITIVLTGKGTLRSYQLLFKVIASGQDYSDNSNKYNRLDISGLLVESRYNFSEFSSGFVKSDSSSWELPGRPTYFYSGPVEKGAILILGDGISLGNNRSRSTAQFKDCSIVSWTQIPLILEDFGWVIINSPGVIIHHSPNNLYNIIEESIVSGNVIQEDPLNTNYPATFKQGLSTIKLRNGARLEADGELKNTGNSITRAENIFEFEGPNAVNLALRLGIKSLGTGGEWAEDFIKMDNVNHSITINNSYYQRDFYPYSASKKFINSPFNPFTNIFAVNNTFAYALNDEVDLTANNKRSVTNIFGNSVIDSLRTFDVAPTSPKGYKYKLNGDDTVYTVS